MASEVNEEMMKLFSFVDEEDGTIDPERVAALAPVLLELIAPVDLQGENRDRLMLGAGVLVSLSAVIGESVSAGDEIIGELWDNEYAGYLDALLLSCEQYQSDEVVFEICSDALVPLIDAATRSQMAQVKQRVPKILTLVEQGTSKTNPPANFALISKQYLSVLAALVSKMRSSDLISFAPRIGRLYITALSESFAKPPRPDHVDDVDSDDGDDDTFAGSVDVCVHLLESAAFGHNADNSDDSDEEEPTDEGVSNSEAIDSTVAAESLTILQELLDCVLNSIGTTTKACQVQAEWRSNQNQALQLQMRALDDMLRVLSPESLSKHAANIASTLIALIEGDYVPVAVLPPLLTVIASCCETQSDAIDALYARIQSLYAKVATLSVPDDEVGPFFAHTLASACTIVQATCNPDHRRAASEYLSVQPLHAILQRAVDAVTIDERETLMYAAELVQALKEALGSNEQAPAVQALRAKIASDAALRENFAEIFGDEQ